MLWKGFKVKDYFSRSNEHQIKIPLKFLNASETKDDIHTIANITSTTSNHGVNGWLEEKDEWKDNIRENMLAITTDGEYAGTCFYQNFKFISTGHNNVIKITNDNMKKLCDENTIVYEWFAKMFTLIYNTKFHTFIRSITHGNDFENEIIMIPIIECQKDKEIFNLENASYSIDVETITYIFEQIKENHIKEIRNSYQEQLDFWNKELNELLAMDGVKEEIDNIKWKNYKVGDLFDRSNEHQVDIPKKFLLTADNKSETNNIAVVTASTINNGIDSWIAETPEIQDHIYSHALTIAVVGYAGACFYQTDRFITTGNNNMIIFKNDHLKDLCDKNEYGYRWFAKMLTLLYMNKFHVGFKRTLARGNDFNNEIIMLPMYNNDFSINMMAYIYIVSNINIYKNKIKEFNENGLSKPFPLGKDE